MRSGYMLRALTAALIPAVCHSFVSPSAPVAMATSLKAAPTDIINVAPSFNVDTLIPANDLFTNVVAGMGSSSMMVAETEAWVQPLSLVLGPVLSILSIGMLCRIVLSWYPTANVNELPFNLVVWPTEPFLKLVRGSVPPAFGVDITPVVWLGIFTFLNEILLGQQGLLTMKMKYGI
ncbi:hypothetical protein ACHAXN_007484 [Cyclotella atomus]